jgi:monofunctional biosynthetic peptidoglycan transglycosylase
MLEMVMDKRRIFEIYLNVIELGSGVFGAEAGARRYFGVSAAALGPSEAARLAVMLPNPRYFGKHMDSNYLARRSALIQQRMNSSDLP